jgi:hypothetical protein
LSAERKPQIFDPTRPTEPKYFTRVPDDAIEDPRLSMSTLGVFAQLLKRHWTDERTLKITQGDLANRCRMTVRKVRPHLIKLENCGYITRERDHDTSGGPTRISLTYQLRPSLEMSSDIPIAKGTKRACDRTKRSDCDRTKRDPVDRTKRSDCDRTKRSPLILEREEREKERENTPKRSVSVASAPDGTTLPLNSLQNECISVAASRWGASNGDSAVGDLLRSYEADLVREAIDRHWAKVGPALNRALLIGTCRGMLAAGWKREQPAQRRSGGDVPYKPEGPVPAPVAPMTEEERAAFKAEGKRLRDQSYERMKNGRSPKQEV